MVYPADAPHERLGLGFLQQFRYIRRDAAAVIIYLIGQPVCQDGLLRRVLIRPEGLQERPVGPVRLEGQEPGPPRPSPQVFLALEHGLRQSGPRKVDRCAGVVGQLGEKSYQGLNPVGSLGGGNDILDFIDDKQPHVVGDAQGLDIGADGADRAGARPQEIIQMVAPHGHIQRPDDIIGHSLLRCVAGALHMEPQDLLAIKRLAEIFFVADYLGHEI